MMGSLGLCMVFTLFALAFAAPKNLPILSFDEGYTQLFGDSNLMLHRDGKGVHISLDERTGAGFVSQDLYLHGFFSASIKLPSDYTAGVVVAFYMSNGDIFQKNHDELDFEFLGNIRGKEWRIQTNIYGNGSTGIGREERYGLWFDPSEDFHQYSILWTDKQIMGWYWAIDLGFGCKERKGAPIFGYILHAPDFKNPDFKKWVFSDFNQRFFVDNIPIRKIKRNDAMGGDFPSKPMSLYATIWDGSTWATSGGRYKVNYKYAPYIAEFHDLILHGCAVDPLEQSTRCGDGDADQVSLSEIGLISSQQESKMEEFRKKYMTYSYCYDRIRYPSPPMECVIDPHEAERFRGLDGVRFGSHRQHRKRHHRSRSTSTTTL